MTAKPKIHAMLNIFNEASFIERVLRALKWCDSIIVVDGAFMGYPVATINSDDGTLEIINVLKDELPQINLITMKTRSNTWLKNAEALLHVPMGDYILRVDGDEVLEGRHELLRDYMIDTNMLPLYQIDSYPLDLPAKHWLLPRLIKHTPELKITNRHLTMTNTFTPPYTLTGGRGMVHPFEANISFMHFVHYCYQRDEKRKQNEQVYDRYYYTHLYPKGYV